MTIFSLVRVRSPRLSVLAASGTSGFLPGIRTLSREVNDTHPHAFPSIPVAATSPAHILILPTKITGGIAAASRRRVVRASPEGSKVGQNGADRGDNT